MNIFWFAAFWLIPIWVFLLIPFMTFYYEADDGMLMAGTSYAAKPVKKSRLLQACCYQLFVVVIVGIFFAVMYIVLKSATIPVEIISNKLPAATQVYTIAPLTGNATFIVDLLQNMNTNDQSYISSQSISASSLTLTVDVATFYGGLMAWLGWFLFALFGGIGLAAMPLDLVLAYYNRPRHMDAAEYAEAQQSLRDRVNELVDIGELIKIEREEKAQVGLRSKFGRFSLNSEKRATAKHEREAYLEFKQAVYLLEEDVEDFQNATVNWEKYNFLLPYSSLLLGICSFIISIFWFVHVIVYVYPTPPLTPFLNNYFAWFDQWFPLFGAVSVAIFSIYLLFAAVKGCFKFGIRFMFFQIHPMKPSKTYMSSFLFNIALVLLCALPVVQFCQEAFADYAAFSTIRQLFGVQVQNLTFFGWFWTNKVFIYIFMACAVLSTLYLWCRPKDKSTDARQLRDRLRQRTTSARKSALSVRADSGGGS
jgi:LMBR1 domain-containing protein 1